MATSSTSCSSPPPSSPSSPTHSLPHDHPDKHARAHTRVEDEWSSSSTPLSPSSSPSSTSLTSFPSFSSSSSSPPSSPPSTPSSPLLLHSRIHYHLTTSSPSSTMPPTATPLVSILSATSSDRSISFPTTHSLPKEDPLHDLDDLDPPGLPALCLSPTASSSSSPSSSSFSSSSPSTALHATSSTCTLTTSTTAAYMPISLDMASPHPTTFVKASSATILPQEGSFLALVSSSAKTLDSSPCTAPSTGKKNLLDLPTEILEVILRQLVQPQSFVRACRQLYRLSKSPFLRSKYLLGLHGKDQVLTRKTVESHRLTCSILTSAVVSFLMDMGATYRDKNEFIFRWACSKGHKDLVSRLLLCQPRIDLHQSSDWFLRDAAENGQQDIVTMLLQHPDYVPSHYGLNKAFEAAYLESHLATAKALLDYAECQGALQEHGPSAHQRSMLPSIRARRVQAGGLAVQKDEDRALRYAVLGNDVEMVRLLIEYGANVHAFQESSILVASQKGHVEILKELLLAGADIEVLSGGPLRYAAEKGHVDVVRILCENGADTHWGGCSALRNAAYQGYVEILAILLDHDADVNIHEGTPLQLACQQGHEAAVEVLLRYGANHRLDDGAAYKLAMDGNHDSIMAMLIQAEKKMRAKEHELEKVLQQQQASMMAASWNPSHTRALSANQANPFPSIAQGITRGHKRFYSQMANGLSVTDLFRTGPVCGLVALDDEIRSRQRSESNRL